MRAGSLTEIDASLGLMHVVHVQIVNLTDELTTRHKAIPGAATVETQADRVSLRMRVCELTAGDLLDRIHALGARIRMFQPEAMDMETAFMKLTEGKTA